MFMEAGVDPQPWGPDWMPITPKRGPFCMPIHILTALAAITGKDYAEEALSVVHSLNLRSALGIFF